MSSRIAFFASSGILVLILVFYMVACSVVSSRKAQAFERIHLGDTQQEVIKIMGNPADRETAGGSRLTKYGVSACTAPCAQRLWYPNKLSLTGDAWFVDLSASGQVVHAAHITSP
jgi:hypothetical protein